MGNMFSLGQQAHANPSRHSGRGLLIAATIFGLAALQIPAPRASAQPQKDVREVAQESEYIVRARCVRVASYVEMGAVWTVSAFEVTETWKGEPPSPFAVRLPGGEAGGLRMTSEGIPGFTVDEDVVLFLTGDRGRQMNIVGWGDGTFRIRKGRRSGIEKVVRDSAGSQTFSLQFRANPEGQRPHRSIPLATFRAMIADALSGASR